MNKEYDQFNKTYDQFRNNYQDNCQVNTGELIISNSYILAKIQEIENRLIMIESILTKKNIVEGIILEHSTAPCDSNFCVGKIGNENDR